MWAGFIPTPAATGACLTLARDLRRRAYDLVIILHGNDPEATLLAHLTGSPYIIGSARSPLAFAYSATVSPAGPYEHAIERRLNYVRLLGADTTTSAWTSSCRRGKRTGPRPS